MPAGPHSFGFLLVAPQLPGRPSHLRPGILALAKFLLDLREHLGDHTAALLTAGVRQTGRRPAGTALSRRGLMHSQAVRPSGTSPQDLQKSPLTAGFRTFDSSLHSTNLSIDRNR